MSTEVILLIVIAVVLVVDFILNGRKKSFVDETIDRIEGAKPIKSKNFLDYIIKRKRNIVSFTILVHILKILINFFSYPMETDFSKIVRATFESYQTDDSYGRYTTPTEEALIKRGFNLGEGLPDKFPIYESFTFYIELVYTSELWLFIPSFIILSVFVWLINDKIKAR